MPTPSIIVRDVNGNTIGHLELEGQGVVQHVEAHLTDDGDVMVTLTLRGELWPVDVEQHRAWEESDLDGRDAMEPHSVLDHPDHGLVGDPLDRAEHEENDARVGSLEDRGFPYGGGYGA